MVIRADAQASRGRRASVAQLAQFAQRNAMQQTNDDDEEEEEEEECRVLRAAKVLHARGAGALTRRSISIRVHGVPDGV